MKMEFIVLALMLLLGLVSTICSILILIAAFQDEVWKGLLCFFCGFYWLYYALLEFQHPKKGLILLGVFAPGLIAVLLSAAASALVVSTNAL